ncbi:MAG: riboflavin biosynthesis protein RibF [Oscillospiraceae bacterium]|nr:riboflavin biosynthesis protein RibF [Oscillospiraceae bacterium]
MRQETAARVIALGFFDGVHLGHGALLRRAAEVSAEKGARPAVLTFDRHPSALLGGEDVRLLTSLSDRAYLMRRYFGIDEMLVMPFDERVMHMPWESFLTDYLVREHGAAYLVAGHDYRFGYHGEGTTPRLLEKCSALGIGCDIIPAVMLDGITVSSSYIRTLITAGDMEGARRFLGHPHILGGTVATGKKLGTKLGFPTVNLHVAPDVIIPPFGGYATRVILPDGESRPAVTNVGVRPTVDDGDAVTVETYILNYDGDLYGAELNLEFYHYLRPEEKFSSLDVLKEEIQRNVDQVAAYFEAGY